MRRWFACMCIMAAVDVAAAAQAPVHPAPVAAVTFRMSGIVVDREGGQPLAGVKVTTGPVEGNDPAQSMITDEDGRFEFSGLAPQKYWLMAERRGYMRQNFDQHEEYSTAIAVGPKLQSEGLVFRLRPDASISGTITDEQSEPIRDAQVMLFHDAVVGGMRTTELRTRATTDDQGHYHLGHVIPGMYFIAVSAQPWYARRPQPRQNGSLMRFNVVVGQVTPPAPAEEEQHSELDVAYPITFFPGVTDASAATPLEVKAADRASADVSLSAVPALHLVVKGALSNPAEGVGGSLVQHLFGASVSPNLQLSHVGNDLELSGAPPGEYEVTVQSYGKNPASWSRSVELSADAEMSAGQASSSTITGVVEMDGAPAPPSAVVQLWDASSQNALQAQVGDKGEFHFEAAAIRSGDYQVRVLNVTGAAVRAVSAEGAKASGQSVRISGASAVRLRIEISRSLAHVDGVALKDGKPAAGVMVVLVPRDAGKNASLFRRDQSDSDGTFSLRLAVPGTYTVLALADGWDLEWQDPAVLKPYLKLGNVVEVVAGRNYHLEVKAQ
jgi:5-hydroxyisourate hydrolase-like protein (transthyretin family)